MAESSAIGWTDATVNFWWGCTKVGPGCDHCYAEAWNNFRGNKMWGPGAPRRKIKGAVALIRKLQREAPAWLKAHGRRRNVFMHSMSDVFDNEVDNAWRAEALLEASVASQLNIQIVTKRVGNVTKMVPSEWRNGLWPQHVGLMITVVTQAEADRDVGKLLLLKAAYGIPWIGLSIEPMQEPILLKNGWLYNYLPGAQLDWVICGGESGAEARPMHPDWARSLRDQCAGAGVPFFFKQWGQWDADALLFTTPAGENPPPNMKVGVKRAGRKLDGVEHDAMFRGCR